MAGSYHGRPDERGSDMQGSSEIRLTEEKIGFGCAQHVKFNTLIFWL